MLIPTHAHKFLYLNPGKVCFMTFEIKKNHPVAQLIITHCHRWSNRSWKIDFKTMIHGNST